MSARARLSVAFVALLAASISVGTPSAPVRAQTAELPNILIFLTDDQRQTGTLNVMPDTSFWFGQKGTTFTQGFAPTPLCCPARATTFSGRYAHNTGVLDNGDALDLDQASTLQRYLHDNGYYTGIFGKFLNRWPLEQDPPHFDRWAIFQGVYGATDWNSNGDIIHTTEYTTDYITKRARWFINGAEANDSRPWLMFVTPYAPHYPYTPERDYLNASVPSMYVSPAVSETDRLDKPAYVEGRWTDLAQAKNTRAKQLRTLMSVDDTVGNLFAYLGTKGERTRTVAFFLSDNGFMWREHGLMGKPFPYSQSIRIPYLMYGPSYGVAAGKTDGRNVTLADVMPTVLDFANVTPDPEYPVDGRSLLTGFTRSTMLNEYWHEPNATANPIVPTWASIRTGTYQYVEYYAADATTVIEREYYNLVNDPWQNLNLLGDTNLFNDPDVSAIAEELHRLRECQGTSGDNPCP